MKFRLKGACFAAQKIIEFDSDNVTVCDVKLKVVELLSLDNSYLSSIELSFNGKKVIKAADEETLKSVGFVSGDAIFILGLNGVNTDQHAEEVSKQITEPCRQDSVPTSSTVPDSVCPQIMETTQDEMNLQLYNRTVEANPEKFQTAVEKLGCLVHIFMIDTGFTPVSAQKCDTHCVSLPDSWNRKNGTLKLDYMSTTPPNPHATVVISEIGPLAMIYGVPVVKETSKVKRQLLELKLKLDDHIPPGDLNKLRQLTIDFKDNVSFPLLLTIQQQSNASAPPNLSNLPPEIIYVILSYLDIKSLCHLAITSKFFRSVVDREILWKQLFTRNFPEKANESSTSVRWKERYKDEVVQARKRIEEMRKMISASRYRRPFLIPPGRGGPFPLPFPNPGVFPNRPGQAPFPRFIGGDYDIYPDMTGFQQLQFPSLPRRISRFNYPDSEFSPL